MYVVEVAVAVLVGAGSGSRSLSRSRSPTATATAGASGRSSGSGSYPVVEINSRRTVSAEDLFSKSRQNTKTATKLIHQRIGSPDSRSIHESPESICARKQQSLHRKVFNHPTKIHPRPLTPRISWVSSDTLNFQP